MKLVFTQIVNAGIDRVQAFYGDARNLLGVSPPFPALRFDGESTLIRQGAEFAIQLDFLLFQMRWPVRIEEVVEGEYFVDASGGGVIKRWRHKHGYVQVANGTKLVDEVEVELPAVLALPARFAITLLFTFRKRAFARVFA